MCLSSGLNYILRSKLKGKEKDKKIGTDRSSRKFLDWENHLLWSIFDGCNLDIAVFVVVKSVQQDRA